MIRNMDVRKGSDSLLLQIIYCIIYFWGIVSKNEIHILKCRQSDNVYTTFSLLDFNGSIRHSWDVTYLTYDQHSFFSQECKGCSRTESIWLRLRSRFSQYYSKDLCLSLNPTQAYLNSSLDKYDLSCKLLKMQVHG